MKLFEEHAVEQILRRDLVWDATTSVVRPCTDALDETALVAVHPRGVYPVTDLRLPVRLEVRREAVLDDEGTPLLGSAARCVNECARSGVVDVVELVALGRRTGHRRESCQQRSCRSSGTAPCEGAAVEVTRSRAFTSRC